MSRKMDVDRPTTVRSIGEDLNGLGNMAQVTDATSPGDLIRQERKPIGILSLIAGGFSIGFLVLLLHVSPPGNSAQQLSYVASHGALVNVFEFSVILWATLSAPFAFALGVR